MQGGSGVHYEQMLWDNSEYESIATKEEKKMGVATKKRDENRMQECTCLYQKYEGKNALNKLLFKRKQKWSLIN